MANASGDTPDVRSHEGYGVWVALIVMVVGWVVLILMFALTLTWGL